MTTAGMIENHIANHHTPRLCLMFSSLDGSAPIALAAA